MKKTTKRKPVRKKTTSSRKKKSSFSGKKAGVLIVLFLLTVLVATTYHYRDALAYYFSFKTRHNSETIRTKVESARIFQVLEKHKQKVLGFDISEYQSDIEWDEVLTVEDSFKLEFVFIRATAGKDKVDSKFKTNWEKSKEKGLLRGAYHYYRPNENSLIQAENFIKTVHLEKGDFPPVLDIENIPKNQPMDSLKVGLKRWLAKVEKHYKVKPIIYSGERYYQDFLKKEFSNYTFWIANYNFFVEEIKDEWLFWQFTDKAAVNGIDGNVDINIYNGTPKMLRYMTIQ